MIFRYLKFENFFNPMVSFRNFIDLILECRTVVYFVVVVCVLFLFSVLLVSICESCCPLIFVSILNEMYFRANVCVFFDCQIHWSVSNLASLLLCVVCRKIPVCSYVIA